MGSTTTLVIHHALLVLVFAPHETTVVLRSGTIVQKSSAIDYTKYVLLLFLKTHFGIECNLEIGKREFSGGEVMFTISPLEHKWKMNIIL